MNLFLIRLQVDNSHFDFSIFFLLLKLNKKVKSKLIELDIEDIDKIGLDMIRMRIMRMKIRIKG